MFAFCVCSLAKADKAILVGIDKYRFLPNASLDACENDIATMRSTLIRFGFAQSDIVFLPSGDASKERILSEVDKAVAGLKKNERFVYYHSSFGGTGPDGSARLLTNSSDSKFNGDITRSELHGHLVKARNQTENVTLIIDAGFSADDLSKSRFGIYGQSKAYFRPGGTVYPKDNFIGGLASDRLKFAETPNTISDGLDEFDQFVSSRATEASWTRSISGQRQSIFTASLAVALERGIARGASFDVLNKVAPLVCVMSDDMQHPVYSGPGGDVLFLHGSLPSKHEVFVQGGILGLLRYDNIDHAQLRLSIFVDKQPLTPNTRINVGVTHSDAQNPNASICSVSATTSTDGWLFLVCQDGKQNIVTLDPRLQSQTSDEYFEGARVRAGQTIRIDNLQFDTAGPERFKAILITDSGLAKQFAELAIKTHLNREIRLQDIDTVGTFIVNRESIYTQDMVVNAGADGSNLPAPISKEINVDQLDLSDGKRSTSGSANAAPTGVTGLSDGAFSQLHAKALELCIQAESVASHDMLKSALDLLESARRNLISAKDALGEAMVCSSLGRLRYRFGERQNGIRALEEGRAIYASHGESLSEAEIDCIISGLISNDSPTESDAAFQTAIAVLNKQGATRAEAIARNNRAVLLGDSMSGVARMQELQMAISMLAKSGDTFAVAGVRRNLALVFARAGDISHAKDLLKETDILGPAATSRESALNSIAQAKSYLSIKEFSLAESCAQRAVLIAESGLDNQCGGQAKLVLSNIAFARGNFAEAHRYANEAFAASPVAAIAGSRAKPLAEKLENYFRWTRNNRENFENLRATISGGAAAPSRFEFEELELAPLDVVAVNPKTTSLRTFADGKRIALLFGTTEYAQSGAPDGSWKRLPNAAFDAETLGKTLNADFGFELRPFPNAKLETVYQALKQLSEEDLQPEDQVLIFFAGHGDFVKFRNDGFVICNDSIKNDPTYKSWLSYSELKNILNGMEKLKHLALVLDVCFGGSFAEKLGQETIQLTKQVAPSPDRSSQLPVQRNINSVGKFFLTSGSKEPVSDGKAGEHSPFMNVLLKVLKNLGSTGGFRELSEKIELEPLPSTPVSGQFGGELNGRFVFIRK